MLGSARKARGGRRARHNPYSRTRVERSIEGCMEGGLEEGGLAQCVAELQGAVTGQRRANRRLQNVSGPVGTSREARECVGFR